MTPDETRAAITALYPRMRGWALRKVGGDPDRADELTHETVILLLRWSDKFDSGRASFATWAHLLMRTAAGEWNRLSARRAHEAPWPRVKLGDNQAEFTDDRFPSPAAQEPALELSDAIRAIRELSPREQQIVLGAVLGVGFQEQADSTGVTRQAIQQIYSRALTKIKTRLERGHLPHRKKVTA